MGTSDGDSTITQCMDDTEWNNVYWLYDSPRINNMQYWSIFSKSWYMIMNIVRGIIVENIQMNISEDHQMHRVYNDNHLLFQTHE